MKKRFVYLLSLLSLCLCACNSDEYVSYSKYVGVSYYFDDKVICHITYVNDYDDIYKHWNVRLTDFYVDSSYGYSNTFIIATKRNKSHDYYLIVRN